MEPMDTDVSGSEGAVEAQRGGVQVIARAARVLFALEGEEQGLSLGQIAQRVGLARSTVQRIVEALSDEQFVIAVGPQGGVKLGPALLRLAASASEDFTSIIRPIIHTLSRELGETVDVSVVRGRHAVFVDQVPGAQRLCAVSAVGERFPLHCTANGKALLSVLPVDKAAQLLQEPLECHTPATLTSTKRVLAQLTTVRRTGLAFDHDEHTEGISAVGCALLDPLGRPMAVSVPVPSTRYRRSKTEIGQRLLEARARIVEALPSVQRR
jgi:DNA-binding IclR family transcriptional regulator